MDIFEIECDDPTGSGMLMGHNMPCAICTVEHAVVSCNTGIFAPCWKCQTEGWDIVRSPKKFGFWHKVGGWFNGYYEFTFVNTEHFSPKKSEFL